MLATCGSSDMDMMAVYSRVTSRVRQNDRRLVCEHVCSLWQGVSLKCREEACASSFLSSFFSTAKREGSAGRDWLALVRHAGAGLLRLDFPHAT